MALNAALDQVQYVADAEGKQTAVLVPIDLWRELASERETAYLLKSDVMRERLMMARGNRRSMSLFQVVLALVKRRLTLRPR